MAGKVRLKADATYEGLPEGGRHVLYRRANLTRTPPFTRRGVPVVDGFV